MSNYTHQTIGTPPVLPMYEKAQLLKILEADWSARTADAWKPHPLFGKMTPKEWGKLSQIHVGYHLRQFAA